MLLRDIGEKRLISSILRPLFGTDLEVPIGDDAAVIRLTQDLSLVLTVDKIPERLVAVSAGIMTESDVGRYLVVANISDLAAMGADPVALLLTLCLPADTELEDVEELAKGVATAAAEYGAPVVGGDTGGGSARCLVVAAVGTLTPGTALRRSGAGVGNALFVTGEPGKFGAALAYILAARPNGLRLPPVEEAYLFERFTMPKARLAAGKALRALGYVTACQDISDGVAQTARELATSSKVGIRLFEDLLRTAAPPQVDAIADAARSTAAAVILGPGADFELMFTAPPEFENEIRLVLMANNLSVHRIGECIPDSLTLVRSSGAEVPLPEIGWQHFSGKSDAQAIRDVYSSPAEE